MDFNDTIARRLALLGAVLVMLGLLTGFVSGSFANPRMGLAGHLEGLMNGTLLLAVAAAWKFVVLPEGQARWAFRLFAFGTTTNWLAVTLAGVWGAGAQTMPLTAAGHSAAPWQEYLISILLVVLSIAMVAAVSLLIKGFLASRR
ncbi:hypothetical protein [Novosphingobium sp.]|uniref:hypothetical protein n=1 Tax=Novosphingobium sp. TaxID=1874826 RepID=UPI0035ADDE9C